MSTLPKRKYAMASSSFLSSISNLRCIVTLTTCSAQMEIGISSLCRVTLFFSAVVSRCLALWMITSGSAAAAVVDSVLFLGSG